MKTINYTGTGGYHVSEKHSISSDDLGVIWEECDLKIGTFKWCPVYNCQRTLKFILSKKKYLFIFFFMYIKS